VRRSLLPYQVTITTSSMHAEVPLLMHRQSAHNMLAGSLHPTDLSNSGRGATTGADTMAQPCESIRNTRERPCVKPLSVS